MRSDTAISGGGVSRSRGLGRSRDAGSRVPGTSRGSRSGGGAASGGGTGIDVSAGRVEWRRPGWGGLGALGDEEGSATAEYAIATMAAVGFAGLLVVILKGDEVRSILTDLVTRALTAAG
ncbi:DUF4244 domain-containing protein [Rathayibacter sp. AY1G1]|nr:DUF4244 domain-containing protein [Rathayibacter sp. AY1F3]PPH12344.1 DUF4244 domain-containing protein [Rathayibacter sp. AY1G1]PPH17231.1 DUF4244 domain-containing protein [Rathayibacter sp. AY1F8]PPH77109.1 DUF4244 domain-containing protein [Rathayibacter sp. AY1D4]PPH90748.1 DUF4244 domain-containing protein [Rathayibacter sp. AY1D3]